MATVAGTGLLAAQLAALVYAHVLQPADSAQAWDGCSAKPSGCTRYFAWAPNDYLVPYELTVRTASGTLRGEAARHRYSLGHGPWEFPLEQLQDIIRQRESHDAAQAAVELRYRINQRPWQTWTWRG